MVICDEIYQSFPEWFYKYAKRQKLWNLTIKFNFPEAKVFPKELTRKMEIITLGSSFPIILD